VPAKSTDQRAAGDFVCAETWPRKIAVIIGLGLADFADCGELRFFADSVEFATCGHR
jgi:hypothetical protein